MPYMGFSFMTYNDETGEYNGPDLPTENALRHEAAKLYAQAKLAATTGRKSSGVFDPGRLMRRRHVKALLSRADAIMKRLEDPTEKSDYLSSDVLEGLAALRHFIARDDAERAARVRAQLAYNYGVRPHATKTIDVKWGEDTPTGSTVY